VENSDTTMEHCNTTVEVVTEQCSSVTPQWAL
jgi:hypothetical protein